MSKESLNVVIAVCLIVATGLYARFMHRMEKSQAESDAAFGGLRKVIAEKVDTPIEDGPINLN